MLALYFFRKDAKWKILNKVISATLIGVSLGCHQAFLSVFLLGVLITIMQDLKNNTEIKVVLHNFFKAIIVVLVGVLIKIFFLKLLLFTEGDMLSSYKGANSTSIIDLITRIPMLFKTTYNDFYSYFFNKVITVPNVFYIILAIEIVSIIYKFKTMKKWGDPQK